MNSFEVVIRSARPDDAPRLHDLHTASVRALCSAHYSANVIEAWLGNRSASGYLGPIERGDLFVAERDGRIVGFGEAVPGTVIAVYVDPAHVLKRVGIAILRHALTLANREHAGPVRLEATLNARDFYERAGFREVRRSTVSAIMSMFRSSLWNTMPANALERTAGSHSLAAAARRGRYAAPRSVNYNLNYGG